MKHGLPAEGIFFPPEAFLRPATLTCLCTYNRIPIPSGAYRTLPAGVPVSLVFLLFLECAKLPHSSAPLSNATLGPAWAGSFSAHRS